MKVSIGYTDKTCSGSPKQDGINNESASLIIYI